MSERRVSYEMTTTDICSIVLYKDWRSAGVPCTRTGLRTSEETNFDISWGQWDTRVAGHTTSDAFGASEGSLVFSKVVCRSYDAAPMIALD